MNVSAGILFAEMCRAGAAHEEAAVEMHVDDIGPVGPAHAVENAVAQNAGIIDQDVDVAESIERRPDNFVGIGRFGD